MAAIAGILSNQNHAPNLDRCAAMMRALEPYSSAKTDLRTLDLACFGRNRDDLLTEDMFDRQPLVGEGGSLLCVADARIDNRDELRDLLPGETRARASDSDFLLAAWVRWGTSVFDHVLGDYAMAVHVRSSREIILLRSPFAEKGLFYCSRDGVLAFASEPIALHEPGLADKAFDPENLARIAAARGFGVTSVFRGIGLVGKGEILCLRPEGPRQIGAWSPQQRGTSARSAAEAGELLRAELDRAVAARLRRRQGEVAVFLSSGRDSTAVAASAALALDRTGDSLRAITGAPREGFESGPLARHVADESGLAGKLSSRYPNMQHIVARPASIDVPACLDELHRLHHMPMLNPTQLPWWEAMEGAAAGEGVSVLLSGGGGNFTISLGGIEFFADLRREIGSIRALSLAALAVRRRPRHSASLLNHGLGPVLPVAFYRSIERATGRRLPPESFELLREPYRKLVETEAAAERSDTRPRPSYRDFRRQLLMQSDSPGKLYNARWGFEHRDPTLDARLVETCHSLPAEYLFSGRSERPAYDHAFGSRLPPDVLTARKRGLQSADWREHFSKSVLRAAFDRYRQSHAVQELFDLKALDEQVERGSTEDLPLLASSLSVASFLWVHFPA